MNLTVMNRPNYIITLFQVMGLVVILLLPRLSFGLSAQNQRGMEILANFDKRFEHLDSLIFGSRDGSRPASLSVTDSTATTGVSPTRDDLNRAIDRRTEAEIGEIKSLTGLRFTGQTYYRLDGDLGMDEEDPVSVYKGKIQAELRWYPFQSALFKRQGRINEQKLRGRIDKLAYDKEDLGMLVERQKEAFRQYSDSLMGGVLLQRIRNLNMLSSAYMYLLENENIPSDDLLQILNEKAEAERMFASLPGRHLPALDLSRPAGYFVEIDTAAYLQRVRKTQADLSTLQLQMELLEQQEKTQATGPRSTPRRLYAIPTIPALTPPTRQMSMRGWCLPSRSRLSSGKERRPQGAAQHTLRRRVAHSRPHNGGGQRHTPRHRTLQQRLARRIPTHGRTEKVSHLARQRLRQPRGRIQPPRPHEGVQQLPFMLREIHRLPVPQGLLYSRFAEIPDR